MSIRKDDEPSKASTAAAAAKKSKGEMLRNKVKTLGRLGKMYTTLKEEHQMLLKIKEMAPDGKLPRGLLLEGKPAIKFALKSFSLAKDLDKENEKRPRSHSAGPVMGKKPLYNASWTHTERKQTDVLIE